MEIALGIIILVSVIGFAWLFSENNKWRVRYVETERALEEVRASKQLAPAAKATKAAAVEKHEGPTRKELDEAREEVKDLKKAVYDLKGENKSLRQEFDQAKGKKPVADSDALFTLREELGQAKAELAEWKERASSSKGRAPVEPTPAPKPAPEPVRDEVRKAGPSPVASAEEIRKLEEAHQAELRSLNDEMRKFEAELTDRLKKTSRNIDKQRQRADNNDRAYKITQRQLDAAQERIEYLESQLKRSNFAAQAGAEATDEKATDEEANAGAAEEYKKKHTSQKSESLDELPAAVTEKAGDEANVEAPPAGFVGATDAGAPQPETIKEGVQAAPEGSVEDVADTAVAETAETADEEEHPPAVTETQGDQTAAPSAVEGGPEAAETAGDEELPPSVNEKKDDQAPAGPVAADQAAPDQKAEKADAVKAEAPETAETTDKPALPGADDIGSEVDDAWADLDLDDKG